jgi:hypothetical protein
VQINSVSGEIVDSAIKVHSAFGAGLLERGAFSGFPLRLRLYKPLRPLR